MPTDLDKRAAANVWLRRAEGFLVHAGTALAEDPEVECFAAQQAAEMAVKAVFLAHGIPHPHTHDIAELLGALERRGFVIPDEIDDADSLTDYATETRYAGVKQEQSPVSEEDRVEAARAARAVLEWAKAEIARAAD